MEVDEKPENIIAETTQPPEELDDREEIHTEVELRPRSPVKVPLNKELLLQGLRSYDPTIDGTKYAPTKFICNKKSLTDLCLLENFRHLRYINVGFNNLRDISPLYKLRNLVVLYASYNKLQEFPSGDWPAMTHLILDNNQIETLKPVKLPRLKLLSLNNNLISKLIDISTGDPYLTSETFPELHTLELAHNKLYLLEGASLDDTTAPVSLKLNLPKLKALFLNYNRLTSLATYKLCPKPQVMETLDELAPLPEQTDDNRVEEEDTEQEMVLLLDDEGSALGHLPELSVLNLRANGLRDLDGLISAALPKLQYLNLRENLITNVEELDKLKTLSRIQTLIMADNPITDMKNYRTDVKLVLPTLTRLDKESYTPEEDIAIAELRLEQQGKGA